MNKRQIWVAQNDWLAIAKQKLNWTENNFESNRKEQQMKELKVKNRKQFKKLSSEVKVDWK